MNVKEDAFLFECAGDQLVGIIAAPASNPHPTGVLVIVGGPQYRVGSHRQFTLLARELAASGIPCMRFDYRGMGDSTGEQRDFGRVNDDLRAAVNVFFERQAGLERVVLWGLCDGASAACFYLPLDSRVSGAVLLNPWVKTATGKAKVFLKHYYLRRLTNIAFWKKFFAGRISLGDSFGDLFRIARLAGAPTGRGLSSLQESDSLPLRMARTLDEAAKPFLVVLSGRDYVAREFEQTVRECGHWSRLLTASGMLERVVQADHTFSSAEWRGTVSRASCTWVLNNVGRQEGCRT